MEIGLYEAVSGMKSQAIQQETISSNLARMSMPGNKRTMVAFEIPKDSDLQKGGNIPGTIRRLGMKAAPLQARTVTDFTPAEVARTGADYDFGIVGDGFFKVREQDGSTSYTRDGQFHLTNEGKMVTLDGATVLGEGDAPITIAAKDSVKVKVDPNGVIRADDGAKSVKIGSLTFAHFDDPRTVLSLGAPNGRFVASSEAPPTAFKSGLGKDSAVMQGALESSNANSVSEMVSLVNVVRAYEASQKLTTAEDTLTGDIVHAMNNT
ncbi:flagellar hook protein FlgE/flagellar basal-body rod protein FlgG [Verrucomicrobium sp. GAS474]|uniref:flagellar hook-basal body protein n=1 Tax=Verrucomicrobium sp. GAS474 TaxID=1882831 RepID=UPI00087AC7EB|nr:flagellar hook-basal body protein [Verrucomicrobium sp. GAS474]SDU24711.1 flagellar hook protein FlgE/flagellar basal-body rod protein FlgG [Verrucomicrobium sp. GAS474]